MMRRNQEGTIGRGRGSGLALTLTAVVLLVGSIGIAAVQRQDTRSRRESGLTEVARQQATTLSDHFASARAIVLLTAQNPTFEEFYEVPGSRIQKIRRRIPELTSATDALRYLETLYPNAIGEACFIDAGGAENARVVHGHVATIAELSPDETASTFFAPTFAQPVGSVYQSEPYLSPDTGEWVISSSTVVPSSDGQAHAIVHFEVTIESLRRAAAKTSSDGDYATHVVNAETGAIVLDSDRPQRKGEPIGDGHDEDFAWVRGTSGSGSVDTEAGRAAFVHLPPTPGNANHFAVVVVYEGSPSPIGAQLATILLAAVAILLFLIGLFSYRSAQELLTTAALTDPLTGLANRRQLLADLAQRYAGADRRFSLAMFDLDGFKAYNDTFGHPAGDVLLIRLAANLRALIGDARAYRLGGDEFCVLMSDHAPARRTADEMAAALSEHGDGFSVGASVGWVHAGEGRDADALLILADKRMYANKHDRREIADGQGRNLLLRVLEERAPELLDHRGEIATLAEAIAREMGLDETTASLSRQAAELHDVGKIAIPDSILRKAGPLSETEWIFMRRHSEIGERVLDAFPSLASVGKLIRSHHERWDGSGYPDGLAGEEIPVGARIAGVLDAYHGMILEERPHRPKVTQEEALEELRRNAGTQFDPSVVEAFARVVEREPSVL